MKKRSLIIILAVLFQSGLHAQTGECQYDKNEIDKFTNKKVIWTRWERLTPLISRDYAPLVRCVVEDTAKQILFYIGINTESYVKPTQESLDNHIVVPAGSKAILLLENGKTVELTTEKELHTTGEYKPPRTGTNQTDKFNINYYLTLIYKLNDDAIKALTVQPVTSIRIYYNSDNHQDYTVSKKKYTTIQNLMTCIR